MVESGNSISCRLSNTTFRPIYDWLSLKRTMGSTDRRCQTKLTVRRKSACTMWLTATYGDCVTIDYTTCRGSCSSTRNTVLECSWVSFFIEFEWIAVVSKAVFIIGVSDQSHSQPPLERTQHVSRRSMNGLESRVIKPLVIIYFNLLRSKSHNNLWSKSTTSRVSGR